VRRLDSSTLRGLARWVPFRAWVPLTIALLMAGYRLLNQDLVPLIADEPIFLRSAREQIFNAHWLSASPLVGNQGLHYGPTILWFYGLLYKLFGSGPAPQFLIMTLLVTAANCCAAFAVGRCFMPRTQLPAALVALVASSPFHFLWSRMCWDQSVEILSGFSIAVLCTKARLRPRRAAVVGVLMGLAISSHLMVTLLAMFIGLYFLLSSRRWWRLINAATYASCILAINVPYLRFLARGPMPQMPAGARLTLESFMACLLEPLRVATTQGIDYFFDADWLSFVESAGVIGHLPEYSSKQWAVLVLLLVALIWTSMKGVRSQRRFARFTVAFWIGYAAFLAQRNLGVHPHYQFPSWWVTLVGVAAVLSRLALRDRGLYRFGLGMVWGLAILQMVFVVEWMSYIRQRGGTRGIHYGSTLAGQTTAVRSACSRKGDRINLQPHVTVFGDSIEYLASALKECDGKVVTVSSSDSGTAVRIEYESDRSARLVAR
jgi:hypothetical protein